MTHDPMREALEPCPFCGANVDLTTSRRLGKEVFCDNCTARAPQEMWNARALTASAPNGEPWLLAAVLRSRGRNNTLHDINRAADMLERASPPPAAGWDEVLSNCDDFLADIVGGAQVTERSVLHAKELREDIEALRREAPAPSGVAPCGIHQKPDGRWGCVECNRSWDTAHECIRPDAGGDVREALEIGRFYADLHHQAAMKLRAFAQANSCKEDIERIDAALSTPSDAGNAIAALQAMLRLFDDQGNMVADFNTVQSAVENGYAVISRQARSEASANGL